MTTAKLYVGNISWTATEEGLKKFFSDYGDVKSARIVIDRDTNRSKGFGFVEMANSDDALTARDALDGVEYEGRPLKVSEAKEREQSTQSRPKYDKRPDYSR